MLRTNARATPLVQTGTAEITLTRVVGGSEGASSGWRNERSLYAVDQPVGVLLSVYSGEEVTTWVRPAAPTYVHTFEVMGM